MRLTRGLFSLLFLFVIIHTCLSEPLDDIIKQLAKTFKNNFTDESTTTESPISEWEDEIARAVDDVSKEMLDIFRETQGLIKGTDDLANQTDSSDFIRTRRAHSHDDSEEMQSDQVTGNVPSTTSKVTVQRLKKIEPVFAACPSATFVATVVSNGVTIGVCVNKPRGPGFPGVVAIGEISLSAKKFKLRITTNDFKFPHKAAIFENDDGDNKRLLLLVADSEEPHGTKVYAINPKDYSFTILQTVNTHFATSVVVWKPTSDGGYHLAVGNQAAPLSFPYRVSRKNETTFYTLEKTYFDHYDSVPSYHVKDICPFSVGGKDYVVVVNFESVVGQHHVDSELFRLDADDKKWVSIQKIKTTGAVDCEVFTMTSVNPLPRGTSGHVSLADLRQETFLAIANLQDTPTSYATNSIIYKFANERFVPFQCLKTVGTSVIKAFDGDQQHGVFALAVSHLNGVQFFQYNGWRFVPTPVQNPHGSLGRGVTSIAFSRLGSLPCLIISNPFLLNSNEPNVIHLEFEPNTLLQDWKKKSLQWCQQARSVDVTGSLQKLEDSLAKDVFLVDQQEPIVIRGDLTFNGPVEVQGIFSTPSVHNIEDNHTFDHKMIHDLDEVNRLLIELEGQVRKTTDILSKALRLDRPHQVVTGQYTFDNEVELSCGQGSLFNPREMCSFHSIHTQILNGHNVVNLANEVIRVDRDQIISRPDLVFQNLHVSGDVSVNGLVNGVNMSHVVTKTGTHMIEGSTIVRGPLSTHDIHVSGLINGVKLDANTILLKSADQEIRSQLIFTSAVSATHANVTLVNGIHLNDLLNKIVTTDGSHVITGRKTFEGPVVVKGNLELIRGTTLNGVDIVGLWKNALWSVGDQEIRAPHVAFRGGLTVTGDLRVESGIINGVRIPNEDLVLNRVGSPPVVIVGPKEFRAPVTKIDHMLVTESLNGIKRLPAEFTSEWNHQLDILIKSKAQTIPAHKTFPGSIHLGGHSSVEGTVSGIDLSQLEKAILKHNESTRLPGTWVINGTVTFNEPLLVSGLVDGVNITSLYANSLKLTDSVVGNFAKVFQFDSVHASETHCSTVNGKVLKRDFMTLSTDQVISGPKVFHQGIHLKNDFTISGTLNGLDIRVLNDSLTRFGNQVISGPKTIAGDLYVNNLVTSFLNGINMNDLIILNSTQPQVITGKKVFNSIRVIGDVNVSNLIVHRDINGVKMDDLFNQTMLYDAPQVVTGLKHFDSITIPLGTNLEVESLNGYRIQDIFSDAVFVDSDDVISGSKVFTGPVTYFRQLNFEKTFDGLSDDQLKNHWLLRDGDQVIQGDLIFKGATNPPLVVVKGDLIINNGTLNGHNIEALNASVVKRNEPALIEGQVTFKGTVTSEGDINVGGTVQGIKFSRDVIMRTPRSPGPVVVHGKKTFKSNVHVDKDLKVLGRIDDVFVDDLCKNVVRRFGDQVITAPVEIKGSITVNSSLTAEGYIDTVDINHLKSGCVLKELPSNQVIQGKKHFKTLVLVAPSIVEGRFGGIDLKHLANNYVSLTRNQVVHTPVSFADGVSFESYILIHGNLITKDGLISAIKGNLSHSVNLTAIDINSLKTYGDQIIDAPIVFRGDVHFSRDLNIQEPTVNNIPFDWMMLKNRPNQEVKTPVIFDGSVHVRGNMDLSEGVSIQGVFVNRARRAMVDVDTGHNSITGVKEFESLEVDHLQVKGLINGIHFSPQNILLASEGVSQVIKGRTVFENDVSIAGPLTTSTINGVDLLRTKNNLFLNGAPSNTISGFKKFAGLVRANDTWAINLIDGVNFTSVVGAIYDRRFEASLNAMDRRLKFQSDKLQKLENVLKNQLDCVDHYRVSSFLNGTVLESSSKSLIFTRVQMSYNSLCSAIQIHRLSPSHPQSIAQVNPIYDPKSVIELQFSERSYLAIITQDIISSPGDVQSCINPSLLPPKIEGSLLQIILENRILQVVSIKSKVSDARIVSHTSNEVCIILTGSPKTFIQCIDSSGRSTHQIETSIGNVITSSVEVIHVHEEKTTFVIIATPADVRIYVWNPSARNLESNPLQRILVQVPNKSSLPVVHLVRGQTPSLILAEKSAKRIRGSRPLIRIFQHQRVILTPFLETQQIEETEDPLEMDSLVTASGEELLFVLTADEKINVYRMRGASGFVASDFIEGYGFARGLTVLPADSVSNDHFIVTSSEKSLSTPPTTRILYSVLRNKIIPRIN